MQITHRDYEVYRIRPIISGKINISLQCPDIGTTFGIQAGIGYQAYRLAFAYGRRSGTSFYNIYADRGEFFRNPEFFIRFKRDTGCLFPVP
jgi:hypothetical protein